ncbi:MAG: AAA family ATPase, partial [Chloroflexota bacterium]|nr:AAA family ATPase [Chloroflexota bacterium]
AHLVEAIERVCAGSGGVVAVVGEAGIGKSRLLGEARSAARDANTTWLEGHSTSYGRSLSYLPFREALRAYAKISDGDDAEVTWTKLRERVTTVLADRTDELLPYLATLIGIRPPEDATERLRSLDAEALRRQVFRSAYALFEGMAETGPTVLALEDWHWADPSSEQLLAHLLPLTNKLLLCWTGRSEPTSAVAHATESCARSGMRYLEIRLLPLTEAESMKMVGNLFGANVPPAPIADGVARRAEGNPFFIQELVRSLIERGMHGRTGATTSTSHGDSDVMQEMPPSVQATLAARLDGLSAAARETVRIAAVIGRTFSYAMLREAHERDVDGALAELMSHGLIRERAQQDEPAFAFTHSLIQESAYASILHERRHALHRRVAEMIRARAGDRTEDVAGLLAYHYTSAEDWEKAQGYLFAVGDQALRIAADAEAIDLYERALDAYTRAFGASWDPFERAVVERKIGEARYRLGEFVVATKHLDRALELLHDPRPRTPGGVRAAIAREFGAQTGHRLSGHLARSLVSTPLREEILQALWTLQLVDYASDFERLSYDILRALNLAERLPPSHRTLRAYFGMTLICHNIGIGRVGTRYARMSERLARELGDPLAQAIASASLGLDHYAVGRYEDAARELRAAAAGYRGAGDLEPWAAVMAYLNSILATQGLLSEAFPIGGELESVGRAANDRRMQAFGPHCRAHVLAWAGQSDLSRTEFERALAMYAQIPDHLSTLIALGEFANLLLRIGELDSARVLVDRGEKLARDHNLRGWWLTPLLTAKAGAELGSVETSEGSQRRSFLAAAERTCARLRSQGRLHAEALPAAYRQIGTLDWLRSKPAAARAAWARSLELAERFGATSEAFETHQTVARLTSSASDDVAAAELAHRMRAGFGGVLT